MDIENVKKNAIASGVCGEDMRWYYLDGMLYIEGTGALDLTEEGFNYWEDLSLTEYALIGHPVEHPWKTVKDLIIQVVIAEGCTAIKRETFSCHYNLRAVSIPASVTEIGWRAFYSCGKLERIEVPYGVTEIPEEMCAGCISLRTAVLPENVKAIGTGAFYMCRELENIQMPSQVETIEKYAFNGCSKLTALLLPEGLKKIGEYAFAFCRNHRQFVIPRTVETIGENAFWGMPHIIYNGLAQSDNSWGATRRN